MPGTSLLLGLTLRLLWACTQELISDFSSKKFHWLKTHLFKTKIFYVKFHFFFLQHWDFLTVNLFPAPESFFSACRHTTQHRNSNFQTVAWSIRMVFAEPNLNFTKRSLGSKFCSRKKTFQAFSSAKPLFFWFSEPNEVSAVSENFSISLVTLDCFLLAICNIFVCLSFQQQPGPRSECPGLHHLYLLHPVFPTVLLDLTNATDKVIASASEYKWRRDCIG